MNSCGRDEIDWIQPSPSEPFTERGRLPSRRQAQRRANVERPKHFIAVQIPVMSLATTYSQNVSMEAGFVDISR